MPALEKLSGKLIRLGEVVAIAEQVGEVGATKGPVRARWCGGHAGSVTDTELLDERRDTRLLALAVRRPAAQPVYGRLALASGQLGLTECGERELAAWLSRLAPAEVLISGELRGAPPLALRPACPLTSRPALAVRSGAGRAQTRSSSAVAHLAGFNAQDLHAAHRRGLRAVGLCQRASTQGRALSHVSTLTVERAHALAAGAAAGDACATSGLSRRSGAGRRPRC